MQNNLQKICKNLQKFAKFLPILLTLTPVACSSDRASPAASSSCDRFGAPPGTPGRGDADQARHLFVLFSCDGFSSGSARSSFVQADNKSMRKYII